MGLFIGNHLPYIPAINIAGIVARLGPGVTKYSIGARIFGEGSPVAKTPDSTGLQEYATLQVAHSALIPAGFSDDSVATLPCNAVTAFTTLFNQNHLALPFPRSKTFDYKSRTLVVIGGGSNLGKLILQFAQMVGLGKVIAVASISGEKELLELGATHVVDRFSDDVPRDVYAAAGGRDVVTDVIDAVSWTYELAAELVRSTGPATVLILHKSSTAAEALKRLGKTQAKAGFVVGAREHFTGLAEPFWGNIGQWLTEGRIRPAKFRIIEGLDAQKVNDALDSYRDGKPVVQAIVHPNAKLPDAKL
ncbi:putative alcohol dehydrogenase [Xylogone sp. PMI_703]|nr:putative alcohol dehydrogenase [Xylogone sp. PMI_703]